MAFASFLTALTKEVIFLPSRRQQKSVVVVVTEDEGPLIFALHVLLLYPVGLRQRNFPRNGKYMRNRFEGEETPMPQRTALTSCPGSDFSFVDHCREPFCLVHKGLAIGSS